MNFNTITKLNKKQILICTGIQKRFLSNSLHATNTKSASEYVQHQNYLFNNERKRLASLNVPRVEKIKVEYNGSVLASGATFLMNKNLSTPYDCAMHISKMKADSTVLAKVKQNVQEPSHMTIAGGEKLIAPKCDWVYWDVRSQLPYDCQIDFLNFNTEDKDDIMQVNQAYWRSCAMVLGSTIQRAFKNDQQPKMLQIPQLDVTTGAFCYDVELPEEFMDWNPDQDDLIFLTQVARSVLSEEEDFGRLVVGTRFARKLFQDDSARLDRLSTMQPDDPVTLYRLGDYIEIIDGPLASTTKHVFHYVVTALHQISPNVRRVQGISLPQQLKVQHGVWTLLENRARRLVTEKLPVELKPASAVKAFDYLKLKESIEDAVKIYNKTDGNWNDRFKTEEGKLNLD